MMKRFMAFALSAAMMLTTVNMPEVTAWAQDTGKVTYYSTWSAAKNIVVTTRHWIYRIIELQHADVLQDLQYIRFVYIMGWMKNIFVLR